MIARHWLLSGVLLGLLVGVPLILEAAGTGAISNPAVTPRGYQNTSLATTSATLVNLKSTPATYPTTITPKSMVICNDNAAGGSDLWCNVNSASTTGATTPVNGVLGDTFIVKAQEKLSFDAMPASISIRGATGVSSVRLIPIY